MASLWLFIAVFVGSSLADQSEPTDAEIKQLWVRFKKDFHRDFANNDDETFRAAVFRENVLAAYKMNVGQGVKCGNLFDDEQCVFGINDFSDMPQKEFAATKLGYKRSGNLSEFEVLSREALPVAPDSVDWRSKGAVTAVKNQGSCGSCWAFSTTETVESQAFMNSGKLLILSTQQIVACDHNGDEGCDGGDTVSAYKYLENAGGLDTASDYPDTSSSSGSTGKCKWDKKKAAQVSGFSYATKPCDSGDCTNQNEETLAASLAARGPISICVNAGGGFFGQAWQLYRGGVFKTMCSSKASKMDHCVQLVGYDKTGPTPYWIVRNSWAESWGINGYMHLEMGKNLCGVANEATIPQASLVTADLVV